MCHHTAALFRFDRCVRPTTADGTYSVATICAVKLTLLTLTLLEAAPAEIWADTSILIATFPDSSS